MSNDDALSKVDASRGRRICRVDRILFTVGDEIDNAAGPIEFVFDGGDVLHFKVGNDGESLRVTTEPWVDGFEEFPTPENIEFARTHGKWTRVAVSESPQYLSLINKAVDRVEAILNPFGKLVGVIMQVGEVSLRIEADFDELYVDIA